MHKREALYPTRQLKNSVPLIFCVLALFFFFISPLQAQVVSKEEVLSKYERALTQAEELNLYQEDFLKLLPKIRLASKALLREDFQGADQTLTEVLSDLKLLESRQIQGFTGRIKLEWLEIYLEIFQKYALLALLAYLLVSWPYFRGMLKGHRISIPGKALLFILISFIAILLSFLDLSRYGESAWSFFDIQLVLLTLAGLLGGFWTGALSGVLIGAFRFLLKPEGLTYVALAIGAGALSGFLSDRTQKIPPRGWTAFGVGCLVGTLHGLLVYLPTAHVIPWTYVAFSVIFLALLEGAGVYIFIAVISGILREITRRETERELLKTRLLFLQAQMRPHFLFNALNTISAICNQENAARAQNLVLRLGDFLRGTLKPGDEFVTLRDEMHFIDAYLEIEKARFQNRLKIEKDFHLQENTWSTRIPLLILQPLVENAIRHGIGKKESGGTVHIHLKEEAGFLSIEIADDGVGMDPALIQQALQGRNLSSKELGIALGNIHQRLIHLYGSSYGLQIEGTPGKGTKVLVRIPLVRGDKR